MLLFGKLHACHFKNFRCVEIEALGRFVVLGLYGYKVDATRQSLVLGGHIAEFVEDIILVRNRSHHPRAFGSAFAAREYGGDNLVESKLPDGSASIFFLLLESKDEKFPLLQVEDIAIE